MGADYALVHLVYTIPPALLLSFLYRPLCTKLDVYKICFLITIAVVSTIPWDSYLIRNRIWTYPPSVIVGPTLLDIPFEEVFFFFIQTYNTSLVYLIFSKPILHSAYLRADNRWRSYRTVGQLLFAGIIYWSTIASAKGGDGTYMGLIFIWAAPFLLLLWSLAYQFILGLPLTCTVLPIAIPTLYLWIVDTLALRRGTWVIEAGTKFGYHVWDGLEIEEAVFFLVTNMLIVFGLVAFDNALAVLHAFPSLFPKLPVWPSPRLLVMALMTNATTYDAIRIEGLKNAIKRLSKKSRSFYLASGTFEGRIRIDLVLLYSFCRVADDLVDEAKSPEEAAVWLSKLRRFLDLSYREKSSRTTKNNFIDETFPDNTKTSLQLLPTSYLSSEPLYELMNGFEMDISFAEEGSFPIKDEELLILYGMRVAGTVAQLCLDIVFHHEGSGTQDEDNIQNAGSQMGIALQLVNIARDIAVDAKINRVYIPNSWLEDEDLTPDSILRDPGQPKIEKLRQRLLRKAFQCYQNSRSAIELLPRDVIAPMRVAIESYMEIGRVLKEDQGYQTKAGKATVPVYRRILVAWKALT